MSTNNPLKRGADPYADSEATAHMLGPVVQQEVSLSTAGSAWIAAPISGRIRKLIVVVTTASTVAAADLTLEVGGTLVAGSETTVPASAAGSTQLTPIADSDTNSVVEGEAIEITSDGGSTAGASTVIVQIDPATHA